MKFLFTIVLCLASAFAGAYYSHKMPSEWKVLEQRTKDLKREMEDKVGILGEQTETLQAKLKRCLDEKYKCCKK